MEILLHVLTDYFDFAVMPRSELVDNKVHIETTEVVEEHWDFEAYWALQVTLAVDSGDKPARYLVVVSDYGTARLTLYELVSADVAPGGIIILHLLLGTQTIHRSIRPEFRNNPRFPNNKGV